MSNIYGTSGRVGPASAQLIGEAEFFDFAPCACFLLSCFVGDAQRKRTYARVYENRIEINHPLAPCLCCTQEICLVDRVFVSYFDRQPTRSGMCFGCIPLICCGPSVIFASTPRCLCIELSQFCGQQVKAAPANCFELKQGIFCCNPCYVSCSYPLLTGVKNAETFVSAMKRAVDSYKQKHDLPDSQMAVFDYVSDNFGNFGLAQKAVGP